MAMRLMLMINMLLPPLVGTGLALAQSASEGAGQPENPDDTDHLVRTLMCRRMTDGCNDMWVAADYLQPRPPVRGRFFLRGALLPLAGEKYRLAALLALERPYEPGGVLASRTLVYCSRRHEWRCYEGSPLVDAPGPPLPPQEGPPSGPRWFGQSEIHDSWIDLTPRPHGITCLTLDNSGFRPGDLPSRKGYPRRWQCI